ncbi:MAG: hypothetical protein FWG37_07280 [Clostridia bacterium]|nr:hypothetical protein [Clostridia bacterium]
MDNFREEIVVKQNRIVNDILHALLSVVMVISALMAAMALASFSMAENLVVQAIQLLLFGGIAFLIWWKKDILRLEYEYTFTNGELDFACVYANKKRKNLGSMRIKNVEACGAVQSGSFQRYVSMPGIKKTNWFLNRGAELLFFYFVKDGSKRMIILEPSAQMVEMIKQYLPRGVFQVN